LRKSCFKKRLNALLFSTVAMLGLASCGGSTQSERFVPQRILVLGDESSVIDDAVNPSNGRKYTVNALAADNVTLDCVANPLWVQVLASEYSMVFPSCNPGGKAPSANRIYATANAQVADVTAQIERHLASGDDFTPRDLVTVWVGMHDVLSQYRQYPAVSEAQAMNNVAAAGATLAAQINRIAAKGSRVLVITVPELSNTPYARTEAIAHPEVDRVKLLKDLSVKFNTNMRVPLLNDGRSIGLVLADEKIRAIVKDPGSEGFVNAVDALCDLPLPAISPVPPDFVPTPPVAPANPSCTSLALRTPTSNPALTVNGNVSNYLWASDLHLSPGAHRAIGLLANTRAGGNPF
jgi:outer membrane lipase/esterase